MAPSFEVFVPDALWLRGYVVSMGGARINARMTVIKLCSGEILIHSPCAFDEALAAQVAALGPVAAIIAPGNFHWLHVRSCQQAFPRAVTYVCPGVEKRAKGLTFNEMLGDEAPALWAGELSQVYVQGTRVMREVAFFHHAQQDSHPRRPGRERHGGHARHQLVSKALISDDRAVEHAWPGARVSARLG